MESTAEMSARYFTGKACKYGHVAERYKVNGDCVVCRNERTKAYAKANREKMNVHQRTYYQRNKAQLLVKGRRERGMPAPTRVAPELCELCGQPSASALHLDHCHETGAFRGGLCFGCNVGLGKFGDSLVGLRSAVKYLERAYAT